MLLLFFIYLISFSRGFISKLTKWNKIVFKIKLESLKKIIEDQKKLLRCDQFHKVHFFLYFFHVITRFSISFYSLVVSSQSWQKCLFYFRFVSKSHQKCQEKCRDLQIFLVESVLSGFFMIWDMMGQTIPDSRLRDIEYDHLVWRLILCCGTPIKAFEVLKNGEIMTFKFCERPYWT